MSWTTLSYEPSDGPKLRGVRVDELGEDFRTACISRAKDDRSIAMQKQ